MNRVATITAVATALALLASTATTQFAADGAQAPAPTTRAGAKLLFYGATGGASPEMAGAPAWTPRPLANTPTERVKQVGVHYWIEVGGVGVATADRPLKSSDQASLHLRSNVDGYFALWAVNTAGQTALIFPTDGGFSGLLKAGTAYLAVPGPLAFEPASGERRLLLFFSRRKLPLPGPAKMPKVTTESAVILQALGPDGARALVSETEQQNPVELGTYVVNEEGGPVIKEIRLTRESQQY